MRLYNDNKLIIEQLAKKYGTSYEVIREAVESPFDFIYNTLKGLDDEVDDMPDFRIPRFGTFVLKYKHKRKQEEKNGNKEL